MGGVGAHLEVDQQIFCSLVVGFFGVERWRKRESRDERGKISKVVSASLMVHFSESAGESFSQEKFCSVEG